MSMRYNKYCEETGVDPKDKQALKAYAKENQEFGETLTEQQHKDTCDINRIIEKYDRQGFIGHVQRQEPMFMDVSGENLRRSAEIVDNVRTEFMKLDAKSRMQFKNDPIAYMEWLNRPERAVDHVNDVFDRDGRIQAPEPPKPPTEPQGGSQAPTE